jgi:hypothetical protein
VLEILETCFDKLFATCAIELVVDRASCRKGKCNRIKSLEEEKTSFTAKSTLTTLENIEVT